jgi:hypothetical protein
MLAVRSPARETLWRGAHPRRQIKDGNGAVIRLGAPAPMVKRPLTRIAYALGLPALPYPNGERARDFGPTPATPGPPWTHWSHRPALLSSRLKRRRPRLREIVECFFFRRLKGEDAVLRNLGTVTKVHLKSGG